MVNRTDTALTDAGLTRRKLLALLSGGTAAGFVLGSQPWFRSAFATTEPPGPTIPPPSVPEPALTPLATPTVAETAAGLEWDLATIFRFVADEVHYDPYAGALRGSTGTLWGMAGNSIDQALLLASLLAEAQITYRFAIGELVEQSAIDGVVQAASVHVADERKRAANVLLAPETAAAWTGEGGWPRPPEIDEILGNVRDRVQLSVDAITSALAEAGLELAGDIDVMELPERERSQHVWVQYADGPNWIDLDPSIAGAEPGTAYASVVETLDALPDDLFHTVTIRVQAEVVSGGVPTQTELLTHTVRSADVVGLAIGLVHPNAEWLGIAEAITGQQKHVPTLFIGNDVIVKGSQLMLQEGEGVLDALGEEGSVEGQALAEWIEYEIAGPDYSPTATRRTVFDRVGLEQRQAGEIDLTTLPPIEQIDGGASLGTFYVPLAGMTTISVGGLTVPWQHVAVDPTTTDEVTLSASIGHAFPFVRDIARLDQLADAPGRFFADRPNVSAVSVAPAGAPVDGHADIMADVDIIHAHHALVPFRDAVRASAAGVLAGAIDHAAERVVLEDGFKLGAAAEVDSHFVSVGRVFELAAEVGVKVVALQPGGTSPLPDVGAAAAVLIGAALDAGRIVVVPERQVDVDGEFRIGWWEIDPATGHTVDRLDNGRGSVLVELAELLHWAYTAGVCFIGLGLVVAAVAGAVSGAVGVAGGAAAAGMCIAALTAYPVFIAF